jgi:periplasmic protein TonB
MSTPAVALHPYRPLHRSRRRRHSAYRLFAVQLHDIPVAESAALVGEKTARPRLWLLGLVALLVIAAHGVGVWYGQKVGIQAQVRPAQNKLAVELVHPPKPPAPKIEPPPPPKVQPKAPPTILNAAVVPSEAPIAAPVETVAAVVAAPPAPPAPEPVKAAFGGIGYRNNPAPDYPPMAVRQGWQGTVLLRVRVLSSGSVEGIEVVRSSGKKLLDDAAIHTVERWVFAPSTRGATPIDGFATVPIEFKLDT